MCSIQIQTYVNYVALLDASSCISTIACGLCDANANYIILTDNTCQACSVGLFVNNLTGNC